MHRGDAPATPDPGDSLGFHVPAGLMLEWLCLANAKVWLAAPHPANVVTTFIDDAPAKEFDQGHLPLRSSFKQHN